jgi:hypothetical protein
MNHNPLQGRSVQKLLLLIPLVALVAACSDPFGNRPWDPSPVTLALYSAARTEYVGLSSAVDLTPQTVFAVSVDAPGATGSWDFALTEVNGVLHLVPAGTFTGLASRARISVVEGIPIEDVVRAPRDTLLYTADPVPLRTDVVYVVRSRRSSCGLTTGHRYAKMQAEAVDEDRGTARLAIVRNPYCDDRALVPSD